MPSPANDPEYNLTLRQADRAREDFSAILDELDLVKWQLARLPTRAYFCRTLLVATASVWVILAALALWLAR
jgi:hypothetical protein